VRHSIVICLVVCNSISWSVKVYDILRMIVRYYDIAYLAIFDRLSVVICVVVGLYV
jgi:hypothetical protein